MRRLTYVRAYNKLWHLSRDHPHKFFRAYYRARFDRMYAFVWLRKPRA